MSVGQPTTDLMNCVTFHVTPWIGCTPTSLDQVENLAQADVKAVCRELAGGEVVEMDRIERAITEYNLCVRRIKARLTPE